MGTKLVPTLGTSIAELGTLDFARDESRSGSFSDDAALLLGQCSIKVQHEGIGI